MQIAEKHKGITRAIIVIVVKSMGFEKKVVAQNTNIRMNTPSPITNLIMLLEKQIYRKWKSIIHYFTINNNIAIFLNIQQ